MEEFNTLASSLTAGLGDLRGCLILSRDGLVLGSSPDDAESSLTPAWVQFAALGDTERGFVQFGVESWCYVRRGPYAAFAIAGPGARPGLVLDQMDQALLAAEQDRARHDGFVARVEATPPTTRPRTLLHPDPAHGKEPVVIDVPRTPAAVEASTDAPTAPDRDLGFGALPRMFDTRPADDRPAPTGTEDAPATAEPERAWGDVAPASPPAEPERAWGDVAPATPPADEPERASADVEAAASERELDLEPSVELTPEIDRAYEPLGFEPDVERADEPTGGRPTTPETSPWEGGPDTWDAGSDEPEDVDVFSLAQEFGQLLQRGEDPADG